LLETQLTYLHTHDIGLHIFCESLFQQTMFHKVHLHHCVNPLRLWFSAFGMVFFGRIRPKSVQIQSFIKNQICVVTSSLDSKQFLIINALLHELWINLPMSAQGFFYPFV
jgi:hypothetical protein